MGVEAEHGRLHFGAVRLDLHLPGAHSLKEKRAVLRRAETRLRDLGCAVAEVGAQDRWQRAVLGVTIAASTPGGVDRILDRLVEVIENDPRVVVLDVHEQVGDVGPQ